jgi:hypothetical protein
MVAWLRGENKYTLFPSLEFFSTGFFSSKVLMRHILDEHPKGSVMNKYMS